MDFSTTLRRARADIAAMRRAVNLHRARRGRLDLDAVREAFDLNMVRADAMLAALEVQKVGREVRADAAVERARRLGQRVEQAREQQPEAGPEEQPRRRRLIGWERPAWLSPNYMP